MRKKFQYAGDTIILTYKIDLKLATQNLEQSLKTRSDIYKKHRLMLNHSRVESITCSKQTKTKRDQRKQFVV